jgi:hypothetical protein
VGDEHDGLVEVALQPDRLLLEFGSHDRVDGAERLVHQEDVGVRCQPARDADALLLASRELARVAVRDVAVESDGVEQLEGLLTCDLARHAVEHGHGGHVVDDGEMREQARVLHDVADRAAQCDGLAVENALAVDLDGAGARVDHAVDHAQQGGLAAAGGADEHRGLARGENEVEVVDGQGAVCEFLADGTEFDHVLRLIPREFSRIDTRQKNQHRTAWATGPMTTQTSGHPDQTQS